MKLKSKVEIRRFLNGRN